MQEHCMLFHRCCHLGVLCVPHPGGLAAFCAAVAPVVLPSPCTGATAAVLIRQLPWVAVTHTNPYEHHFGQLQSLPTVTAIATEGGGDQPGGCPGECNHLEGGVQQVVVEGVEAGPGLNERRGGVGVVGGQVPAGNAAAGHGLACRAPPVLLLPTARPHRQRGCTALCCIRNRVRRGGVTGTAQPCMV